jgi:hypothetical protein
MNAPNKYSHVTPKSGAHAKSVIRVSRLGACFKLSVKLNIGLIND